MNKQVHVLKFADKNYVKLKPYAFVLSFKLLAMLKNALLPRNWYV